PVGGGAEGRPQAAETGYGEWKNLDAGASEHFRRFSEEVADRRGRPDDPGARWPGVVRMASGGAIESVATSGHSTTLDLKSDGESDLRRGAISRRKVPGLCR